MGKLIIIILTPKTIFENIEVGYINEPNNLKIVEEYNVGEDNSEQIYFQSSNSIKFIKIYECYIQENKLKKGKLIITHKHLRNGFAIKINTYLSCGIPNYLLEYQLYDFVIGNFILSENGKTGIAAEGISTKHTFLSILYYLVKS